jgi:hypothetical protein
VDLSILDLSMPDAVSKWKGLGIRKDVEIPHLTKLPKPKHGGTLEIHCPHDSTLTVAKIEDLLRRKIDGGSRNDVVVRRDTWLAFGK